VIVINTEQYNAGYIQKDENNHTKTLFVIHES